MIEYPLRVCPRILYVWVKREDGDDTKKTGSPVYIVIKNPLPTLKVAQRLFESYYQKEMSR